MAVSLLVLAVCGEAVVLGFVIWMVVAAMSGNRNRRP